MIVIPTGTDAPIYHWPYATVALIVLNAVLLFAVPPEAGKVRLNEKDEVIEDVETVSNFERYSLAVGDGSLHPVQWVTHNFLHFGLMHLAGNMLFLWAFGIVVEGKLGALKYLLAYLAIGTLHGAFVQILLRNSGMDQHAAGASAVVYGLLAVCMVWAPRNELNCIVILLFGFRTLVYHWDLYYTTVALLYIGEQAFGLVFWGTLGGKVMISELGHLSGAFWGDGRGACPAQGRSGGLRGVGPVRALGKAAEARPGVGKTRPPPRAREDGPALEREGECPGEVVPRRSRGRRHSLQSGRTRQRGRPAHPVPDRQRRCCPAHWRLTTRRRGPCSTGRLSPTSTS